MAKKKRVVEETEEEKGAAEEGSLSGRLGEFGSAVMQIAEEKGISKERVLEVGEAARAAAYKKDDGKRGQVIRAEFDEVKKDAKFFLVKEVVDETTREFVEETPADADPRSAEGSGEARAMAGGGRNFGKKKKGEKISPPPAEKARWSMASSSAWKGATCLSTSGNPSASCFLRSRSREKIIVSAST